MPAFNIRDIAGLGSPRLRSVKLQRRGAQSRGCNMGMAVKIEHGPVVRDRPSDLYITGLDHIEPMVGGMLRFVLYVDRFRPDGTKERMPADFDVVMSKDMLPDAIGKALAAIGRAMFSREDGAVALN